MNTNEQYLLEELDRLNKKGISKYDAQYIDVTNKLNKLIMEKNKSNHKKSNSTTPNKGNLHQGGLSVTGGYFKDELIGESYMHQNENINREGFEQLEYKQIKVTKELINRLVNGTLELEDLKIILLTNFINGHGNLEISELDFSDFDGDIFISGMKVKNSLAQNNHQVGGNLIQAQHFVKGQLDQYGHTVEGSIHQEEHIVKGNIMQFDHTVECDIYQQNHNVEGNLYQSWHFAKGNLEQNKHFVMGDLEQSGHTTYGDLSQSNHTVEGNLSQSKHTVERCLDQSMHKVKWDLDQGMHIVMGDLNQSMQYVEGDLDQSGLTVEGYLIE